MLAYPCINEGKKIENININKPMPKATIVLRSVPAHSRKIIPHRLEKITLSDISILHANAMSTRLSVKKLLPISKPKNCEYHNTPASIQNKTLFTNNDGDTLK